LKCAANYQIFWPINVIIGTVPRDIKSYLGVPTWKKNNLGSGKNAVLQETDILALVQGDDDRICSESKGTQK
jgi:hypothetical protein